jgi:hypothetical protein
MFGLSLDFTRPPKRSTRALPGQSRRHPDSRGDKAASMRQLVEVEGFTIERIADDSAHSFFHHSTFSAYRAAGVGPWVPAQRRGL